MGRKTRHGRFFITIYYCCLRPSSHIILIRRERTHGAFSNIFFYRRYSSHFGIGGGITMAKVRDFLGAFCVAAVVLMALVSFVFVGCALMGEFVTITDLGNNLIAAAIVS